MADDQKDRLRAARTRAKLTRSQLAAKARYSESTIRAHENGQNSINADAAYRYAEALHITPSWLLFGKDFAGSGAVHEASDVRDIRVAGLLTTGFLEPKRIDAPDAGTVVSLALDGYHFVNLRAYMEAEDWLSGTLGSRLSHVIVAPVKDRNLLPIHSEVVLEEERGGLVRRSVWELQTAIDKRYFHQGDREAGSARGISGNLEPEDGATFTLIGVVVAKLSALAQWTLAHALKFEETASDAD